MGAKWNVAAGVQSVRLKGCKGNVTWCKVKGYMVQSKEGCDGAQLKVAELYKCKFEGHNDRQKY